MKYIDAEKLIAEIKGKIAELESEPTPADRETILLQMCRINAFREVLVVVNRFEKNSLQQEQPEADLDREIIKYKVPFTDESEYLNETTLDAIARHFYGLGLNARKEK